MTISESLFDLVAPCDRAVAGTSLLACAAVYVAAGLLCLGRLKRGVPPWTGLLPGVPHLAWCLTQAFSRYGKVAWLVLLVVPSQELTSCRSCCMLGC